MIRCLRALLSTTNIIPSFFLKYVVTVKMLRCHEGFFCMSNSGFGQPWGGRWVTVTVAAETGENSHHFFLLFSAFFLTSHLCQRTFFG